MTSYALVCVWSALFAGVMLEQHRGLNVCSPHVGQDEQRKQGKERSGDKADLQRNPNDTIRTTPQLPPFTTMTSAIISDASQVKGLMMQSLPKNPSAGSQGPLAFKSSTDISDSKPNITFIKIKETCQYSDILVSKHQGIQWSAILKTEGIGHSQGWSGGEEQRRWEGRNGFNKE